MAIYKGQLMNQETKDILYPQTSTDMVDGLEELLEQGVMVADTLPIGSVIHWDSEEPYPSDIYEEVTYNPRQLLVNPDFQIWQRGGTFTLSHNETTEYVADMWFVWNGQGIIEKKQGGGLISRQANTISQIVKLEDGKTYTLYFDVNGTELIKHITAGQNSSDARYEFYKRPTDDYLIGIKLDNETLNLACLFEGDIAYPHVKNKYAYDLMECQHKIFVITNITGMVNGSAKNLYTAIQQNLDNNPNVVVESGEVYIDGFFNSHVTNIVSQNWVKNGSIELVIKFQDATENGKAGRFTNGKIILSCELL